MVIGIIAAILVLAVFLQLLELRRFRTTEYVIRTEKVHQEVRLIFVSDLHGFSYGRENERLLRAVSAAKPDRILVGGDLIVTGKTDTYPGALAFCRHLKEIAPLFLTFGNHETRAHDREIPEFQRFVRDLKKEEIPLLNNASCQEKVRSEKLDLFGLEIPMAYYAKRKRSVLPANFIEERLGSCKGDRFSVLMAHNPAFGDDYFDWGADLTLSGHTHGGLVRFPGKGSLLSPELTFFPKYDGGHYVRGRKHLIVSKGLGTHSFHIRIFDRAELVLIRLLPDVPEP